MGAEKRLLAFVAAEGSDEIFLHVDKEGAGILIAALERIQRALESDEVDHEHLFSEEWGGWELSVSDQVDKGRGRPIHHLKIYGWTDESAEKNGFARTLN